MGKKAWSILKRMQTTRAGFKPGDFEALYVGFGFEFTESAGHRKYFHPKHKDLMIMVGRHDRGLTKGYVNVAIKAIAIVIKRDGLSEE